MQLLKIETPEGRRISNFHRLRSDALDRLARGEPLQDVLLAIVKAIESIDPSALCTMLLVSEDGRFLKHVAAPSMPAFFIEAIDNLPIAEGVGACGTAAYRAERMIIEDVATHPYCVEFRQTLAEAGLAACWSEPIKGSDGKLLGTFALYRCTPSSPTEDDLFLISHAAQLAAIAIERKRFEESLALEKRKLEAIIDHLPMMVLVKSPDDLTFQHFNKVGEQWMNVSREQVIGRTDFDLVPPEQAAFYNRMDREVLATGRPVEVPVEPMDVRDFGRRLLKTRKVPILDPDGRIAHILVICEDITEQKRAEEGLSLSAQVFEHAHEGIVIADADARIVQVNPKFTDISGYSTEELVMRGAGLLDISCQSPEFMHEVRRTVSEKGRWRGEVKNVRKSGETYHALLSISAIRSEAGEITHYVALYSDISDLKSHQQQLEHVAEHDPLTGLPNRARVTRQFELDQAYADMSSQMLAVCCVDLDGFKRLNDNYGHEAGDQLLTAVGERLRRCLRQGDTVARIGGDEFVILLGELESVEQCQIAMNRVHGSLLSPFKLAACGGEIEVRASLGVALYPNVRPDFDGLLRQAYQAMYRAKAAGGQSIVILQSAEPSSEG